MMTLGVHQHKWCTVTAVLTSPALPAAASSVLPSLCLIGLVEVAVSPLLLLLSTMSSMYPCLASLTFASTVRDRRPSSFLLPHLLSILRLLTNTLISNPGRTSLHESDWSISETRMIHVCSRTASHLDWCTLWTLVHRPLHPFSLSMAGVDSRLR
jgi:hypothetical protein